MQNWQGDRIIHTMIVVYVHVASCLQRAGAQSPQLLVTMEVCMSRTMDFIVLPRVCGVSVPDIPCECFSATLKS